MIIDLLDREETGVVSEVRFDFCMAQIKSRVPAFAAKVHPLYVALDWQWGLDSHVPSLEEVEQCLMKLIKSAEQDKTCCRWASGGLEVFVEYEENRTVAFGMNMKIEDIDWTNEWDLNMLQS